jgi:hypothetical protein
MTLSREGLAAVAPKQAEIETTPLKYPPVAMLM